MDDTPSETSKDEVLVERGQWRDSPLITVWVFLRLALVLVMPAAVLSGALPANVVTVTLAVIGYCGLVSDSVYATLMRVRVIYDPHFVYEPELRDRQTTANWKRQEKFVVTFDLIKAYVYIAYAFALAYALLSRLYPGAFNVRLGVGAAFYFSVTTIATVGYGDIVPACAGARAMAVIEILIGLLYAILVLSVIAGHLQARSK